MLEFVFRRNFFHLSNKVNINGIKKLEIPQIRIISKNVVSGPTLQDRSVDEMLKLREMGISKIIDFRADASEKYAEFCKKNGFKYFKFPLNDTGNELFYIQETGFLSPKFIKSLKKFFKAINQGGVYMGCQFGIDRTNKALVMNYLLNNKKQTPPIILTWPYETKKAVINRNVRSVSRLFHHMTSSQKKQLGLPEKFREILKEKVGRLIAVNHN